MSAGRPTPLGGPRPMAAGNALSIPFSSQDAATYQYTPGSYIFTAPRAGYWKFVIWGPGDGSANAGSGGYVEYTRFMGVGETAAVVVGAPGTDSTVTFRDGRVITAGQGGAGGGSASGGDVNLTGSPTATAGQGTGGGATSGANCGGGAPANLPFRGGAGSVTANAPGRTPGGGGGIVSGNGGDGMALILFVRT